jgi:ABC-type sugar transport system substrate-binding protein
MRPAHQWCRSAAVRFCLAGLAVSSCVAVAACGSAASSGSSSASGSASAPAASASASASASGSSSSGGNGNVRLGLVLPALSNPFISAIAKGAQDQGVKVLVTGNNDATAEVSAIQDYISAGVDAIGIDSTAPTSLGPVLKQAQAAHIPVIELIEPMTSPGFAADITMNWFAQGQDVGKAVASGWCASRNPCDIGIIEGAPSDVAGAASGRGIVAGLKTSDHVHIVSQAVTGYDATQATNDTASMLTAHRDISFVPTWWSAGTLASEQAIANAGKAGKVGTSSLTGACPDLSDLLKGKIYADSMAFPELVGKDFVDVGVKLAHHQSVPKTTNTPIYPVTTTTAKAILAGKMAPPAGLPVLQHLKQAQGHCPS